MLMKLLFPKYYSSLPVAKSAGICSFLIRYVIIDMLFADLLIPETRLCYFELLYFVHQPFFDMLNHQSTIILSNDVK